MKLLFDNWRNYVLLENIEKANALSIFDFDETIAFSHTPTGVFDKATGETFEITTQEELDDLMKDSDRYEFDFSTLDVVTNAVENVPITKILKKRVSNSDTAVLVLTARKSVAEDDIHRVLDSFGINTDDLYIVGLEGAPKGDFVLQQIIEKYPNITKIEFYDDSLINISSMQSAKQKSQLDNFQIYHVEDGSPKLVS